MEHILITIRCIVSSAASRAEKARRLAELIREFGAFRWVGVYDVTPDQVSVIAWSGPAGPAYPVFPVTKGLTAAAIHNRATVVVGDVRTDPRYLSTLGNTLSEIIVPVLSPKSGKVIGTIDVESEKANAFSPEDQHVLEQCAVAAIGLWSARE